MPVTRRTKSFRQKVSIAYTNAAFTVAATTADVPLLTLAWDAKLLGVTIKHSAQFSDGAGAMSEVSVSVGDGLTTFNQFCAAQNIGEGTPVADTTFTDSGGVFKSLNMTAAGGAVSAHFIATGRNFGDGAATFLTGGLVDFWLVWIVLE